MADARLVEYIRKALEKGYPPEQIKQSLLKNRWPEQVINEAFRELYSPPQTAQPAQEVTEPVEMGFFWKLKAVLFSPNEFFNEIKNEQGMMPAFKYYLILSLIPTILSLFGTALIFQTLLSLISPLQSSETDSFGTIGIFLPLAAVMNYIGLIFGLIIWTGILHVSVFLTGGRKGIKATFKAEVYGSTPILLIGSIVSLIFQIIISLIGFLSGLQSTIFIAIILGFINIGLAVLIALWSLYAIIVGLSKLHEISKGRALLAAILPPIILVSVVLAIVVPFYLGALSPSTYSQTTATGFSGFNIPAGGWQLTSDGKLTFQLQNGAGATVKIARITATMRETTQSISSPGRGLRPDERAAFTINDLGSLPEGSPYSVSLLIEYDNVDTGLTGFRESGTLTGTVS